LLIAVFYGLACFGINGYLTRLMKHQEAVPKAVEPFLSGALTGVCTSFALHPFDLIKARAQVNRSVGDNAGSFSSILRHIVKTRGPTGLYSGIVSQVQCSAMFYLSFFGSYNVLCRELKKLDVLSDPVVYFISGGFAGQIAWGITLPLDTIKTRIQVEHSNPPRIRDVVSLVWRTFGVRGFYRGIAATLIRAFPANAALFVAYEWTKKILDANLLGADGDR
jgi:hypothetical protein